MKYSATHNISRSLNTLFTSLIATTAALSMNASQAGEKHTDGITAPRTAEIAPTFDIVHAKISTQGNIATFHMAVADRAGTHKPTVTGKLAGSQVFSYVWPTTMDSGVVGFEKKAGILALAVTSHGDFDDTPLFDENADNNPNNDGDIWHSHWVVLQPNDQCGEGALGVVDIPKGSQPKLPKTWPGLPILLDSPGWDPTFVNDTVEVRIPFDNINVVNNTNYDGVTAGLRVNQSVHAPLLCVIDVKDIASGDLRLPGNVSLK